MAQNIQIAGATFNAVPSIVVPVAGGGSATFVDPSPTTAAATDVASGKLFFDALGTLTQGTASGGGGGTGLEYETGEYTPSEDVSLYYVYFTNAHATAPMYYAVADVTASSVQKYSNFAITYTNFESAFGGGGAVTTSAIMYGLVGFRYNSGSNTSSTGSTNLITVPLAQSDGSTSSHPTFWATNERITLNTTSNSRYFHAGRTYKWIAVWAPTT